MDKITQILTDENLVLIFSYAPAGLGHLRVINALHDGLPAEVDAVLLGSHDESIKKIHRITSIHPIVKRIYDWMQSGPLAGQFALYYKKFLKAHTKILCEQMLTLLEQRIKQPKKVLVVATHFGLAHQLVAVKERLEKEKNIKINLVVQVTDDTLHPMWYVEGAEMIMVPSELTKQKFMDYAKDKELARSRIEVVPYPVNPKFFEPLSSERLENRKSQLDFNSGNPINVSIPVSGAAVGTHFHSEFIKNLNAISSRFVFWVVSRDASYTKDFIKSISNLDHVKLFADSSDREVVDMYDHLFDNAVISLEVTKPSEQAFKALVAPDMKSGVILLFTNPIGGQEEDNLRFLERHYLIPDIDTSSKLIEMSRKKEKPTEELINQVVCWRGLRLPMGAKESAEFVWWCMENEIFAKMLSCKGLPQKNDPNPYELDKNGVLRFWNLTSRFLEGK